MTSISLFTHLSKLCQVCVVHDLVYIYVKTLNELIKNEKKQTKKHRKKVNKILNSVHEERRQGEEKRSKRGELMQDNKASDKLMVLETTD